MGKKLWYEGMKTVFDTPELLQITCMGSNDQLHIYHSTMENVKICIFSSFQSKNF